jgi:hypothetical protein
MYAPSRSADTSGLAPPNSWSAWSPVMESSTSSSSFVQLNSKDERNIAVKIDLQFIWLEFFN